MKIQATLRFIFNSRENASIFLQSFNPEAAQLPMKRSTFTTFQEDATIRFEITSEDAVAFRATMNSFLQFAHTVEKTVLLVSDTH